MSDLTGGQLTWAGKSGDFVIVCDAWFPEENGLSQLWFGNDIEGSDTKVGLSDYILNPTGWALTTAQIPMWFQGNVDHAGGTFSNVIEGLESNLSYWRTELLDPNVVARSGTLLMPSGESRYAVGSKFALTGKGRRRPSGWPLMFEFQLATPFATTGGS